MNRGQMVQLSLDQPAEMKPGQHQGCWAREPKPIPAWPILISCSTRACLTRPLWLLSHLTQQPSSMAQIARARFCKN
ncbi:hypothetical protein V6N13_114075 [Hibiscus sabdariffa]